ncbi:MAG: hypothetical protein ATN33_00590 [Epulopiscium sp. Nele67-Bin001]|nr:MAG: hypothetical protein ATN33_00590 [Epulopiscium sp. Nele67-Bin001]
MVFFWGMGMMVEAFRQVGTVACDRERLKSLVRIPVSWSAHVFITAPGMLSGPVAFLGFTAVSVFLTSCSWRERWGAGVQGGRCLQVWGGRLKPGKEAV